MRGNNSCSLQVSSTLGHPFVLTAYLSFALTPSSVYWMRGPAGVGKLAIAQTCAEQMRGNGYLGAAFFFTVNELSTCCYAFGLSCRSWPQDLQGQCPCWEENVVSIQINKELEKRGRVHQWWIEIRATPFRWATSSRTEPRIVSRFIQDNIVCLTHSAYPLRGRCIRGEFKNMFQHWNCIYYHRQPTTILRRWLIQQTAYLHTLLQSYIL